LGIELRELAKYIGAQSKKVVQTYTVIKINTYKDRKRMII